MTLQELQECFPHLPEVRAQLYLPYLNKALVEGEINTPLRLAAFMAQVGHESLDLHYWEELANGKAYEGRKDLGNLNPGDGPLFKGRGPLQLTGRANYAAAGRALGLPLEHEPKTVATPDVGFRTTVWFWSTHNLNQLADMGNFDAITKRINGGFNGKEDRDSRYVKCKKVFGIV